MLALALKDNACRLLLREPLMACMDDLCTAWAGLLLVALWTASVPLDVRPKVPAGDRLNN